MALVGASGIAVAQERGSISGRVTDKRTGHALPFASIAVPAVQKGGLTDSEGNFVLSGLPVGTYDVKVQFLGYKPETRAGVVVAVGKSAVVHFALEDVVVRQEKVVEVSAERRLVEVKQGATIRSVSASEIRNLPVQTISEVLQQQAGVNTENDQIHVRGGRSDETVFVVNGVANRDLVTGQSTAGQLNARSVAEVNVATGAYDVRYGNALSGIVEVKLKQGGDAFSGGVTTSSGSYGGRAFQVVAGGPDPILRPLSRLVGLKLPGQLSSIVDVSGSLYDTRYYNLGGEPVGLFERVFEPGTRARLRSSYEDSFLGKKFRYGDFFTPSSDNRWAARYGLTWKPNTRDRVNLDYSKRIAIDQGFSRTFITAQGDQADPAYPWQWAHRIEHAGTIFEDNVQSALQWRRTLSTTGFFETQFSRYFSAQRRDVLAKNWLQYEEPDDLALPDPSQREDYFRDSGDDNVWQDRRSDIWGLQMSLVQRQRRHELEIGLEHQAQSVQYLTIEDPWVFDSNGLGSSHDLWKVHPWVGNLYLRDRLEYEGFTANIGMRLDYWFLGREAERAVADTSNPNISPETRQSFYDDTRGFFGRRYKSVISPRIIVAHPITENSSFFFNYGRFTQLPSYRYVYSKLSSISSEAFPLLGNPNLNPQVSVNYELGAKHQFLPTAAINATFFVKDVYDYPVATSFLREQGDTLVDIFVYLNGHFARSKGFEIELEKRRSNHWSGKLSYTFQQTKGKSSDPNEQKIVEQNGGDAAETRLSETFVRWNRPHKLSASFDMRFDQETPRLLAWMQQSGLNLFLQGQSGRPFTPINELGEPSAEPFSKNALFQTTVDMRFNRWFKLGTRRLDVSVAATNVFSNRLVYRVDRVTGHGRVWGVGEYDPEVFDVDENTFISEVLDPSNYGGGRQWRLSLDYDF
ncbi:MAG: TonB-dependent receptor [Candidatus Eisenbacteria bacterium]|uniref:TonB-dependent receptor n=1 Tax=Eiseniibacteriota bacterium TaxID=2212470 RepID=A0A849SJ41_UNCEI|nr:TonB-dependent receptor [Candidatus Eisenbacteria bacterium]